jgi:hypothetical protein
VERGGRRYRIDLGGDSNDEKKTKLQYTLALDGRRSIVLHPSTNQKRAGVSKGGIERWRDHRGAWGRV